MRDFNKKARARQSGVLARRPGRFVGGPVPQRSRKSFLRDVMRRFRKSSIPAICHIRDVTKFGRLRRIYEPHMTNTPDRAYVHRICEFPSMYPFALFTVYRPLGRVRHHPASLLICYRGVGLRLGILLGKSRWHPTHETSEKFRTPLLIPTVGRYASSLPILTIARIAVRCAKSNFNRRRTLAVG